MGGSVGEVETGRRPFIEHAEAIWAGREGSDWGGTYWGRRSVRRQRRLGWQGNCLCVWGGEMREGGRRPS
eukprot:365900-Chlamydomonas_euryale.AAC.22